LRVVDGGRGDPKQPPRASLRIAVFSNTLVPLTAEGAIASGQDYGGVDFGTWALTRAMAQQGHDVHVVTTYRGGARDVALPRWTVHHLDATVRIAQTPIAASMLTRPDRVLPVVDVVLARMGNQPAPLAAARFARRRGVPLVVSYHGEWTSGYGSLARRLAVAMQERFLARHVLGRAKVVIALSQVSAESSPHLKEVHGKVLVVPNGVDPALLRVERAPAEVREGLGVPGDAPLAVAVP
jgi:glycosyltransferase involved in cell wall biosynthesis